MGYESKIYVVKKTMLSVYNKKFFAEKIAEFNLGKVYGISGMLQDMLKTDCYICSDDGGTPIIKDMYGEELTECTPKELVEIIEDDIEINGENQRYNLILATLRELVKLNYDNIYCLHYGY